MNSTPSVLCVVDLSHRSAKVIQHGAAVAEHFGARFVVATVGFPELPRADDLEMLIHRAVPASRLGYELRVLTGPPPATILRLAREEGIDLLVIGTHGARRGRDRGFGSTTDRVLRDTDLPVLVVPNSVGDLHSFDERGELSQIGSVLAPVDFTLLSRRDARIAASIAETLRIPLVLLHVSPAPGTGSGLEQARALVQLSELREEVARETPVEALVLAGEPADVIAAVVAERNVGLVVMGLRGAGGVRGPRQGSIAYRMLGLSPTMLLALPPVLHRTAPASSGGVEQSLHPIGFGRQP
jgi:nucleotide-binding universal stress UspA family protein